MIIVLRPHLLMLMTIPFLTLFLLLTVLLSDLHPSLKLDPSLSRERAGNTDGMLYIVARGTRFEPVYSVLLLPINNSED